MKPTILKFQDIRAAAKQAVMIFFCAFLVVSCKDTKDQAKVVEEDKQALIDSMNVVLTQQKMELAKQKSIDSMQAIVDKQKNEKPKVVYHNTTTTTEKKRKGWSNTAKGAVIGAGVGAITGAAVSKKKGEGAIIGGLAGAGLGAGTGAIIDDSKKNK